MKLVIDHILEHLKHVKTHPELTDIKNTICKQLLVTTLLHACIAWYIRGVMVVTALGALGWLPPASI